jgi:hypothetical protein
MPIRPKAEKKHSPQRSQRTRRKDVHHGGAETQRSVKGKDARRKHAENTEERKVMTENSPVLASGHP